MGTQKASVYQRLSLQAVAAFVAGEYAINDDRTENSDFAIVVQAATALQAVFKQKLFLN